MTDPGLQEVIDFFGLGSPFLYAGTTFACFRLIEDRVSDDAKKAIGDWIGYVRNDREALATAFVEVFDLIFTSPLFTIRAFLRCAVFSVLVTVVVLAEQGMVDKNVFEKDSLYSLVVVNLIPNIFSDYLSLYVVRRALGLKRRSPIRTLLIAALAGGSIVVLLFFVKALLFGTMLAFTQTRNVLDPSFWAITIVFGLGFGIGSLFMPFHIGGGFLILPALVIHIWMPLFALALVLIRLAKYGERPLTLIKWFFKDGERRPVEAVGYVGALCVLIFTGIVKLV